MTKVAPFFVVYGTMSAPVGLAEAATVWLPVVAGKIHVVTELCLTNPLQISPDPNDMVAMISLPKRFSITTVRDLSGLRKATDSNFEPPPKS